MKNRIKEHAEYDSILNDNLKIIDAIAKSMSDHIQETYLYLSFI